MYYSNYAPTPTTDFVGWFRMHNDPKVHKCNMHSTDYYHGNWTERLIEDLELSTNKTSWGRGIHPDERAKDQLVATKKWRGNHPWLPGKTVIEVNYKTFTLWLANSYKYPDFLKND